MGRIIVLLLLGVAIGLPRAGGATGDGWARLRVGMTRAQTAAVIGTALLTSAGRGFEIAIYDGRAEVVFYAGRVVEWTAPGAAPFSAPKGTWQFGRIANAQPVQPTRPQTPRPVTLPVRIQ